MGEGETETEPETIDVEIGGLGGDVTLADLFPSTWIQSHCDATSIREFIANSGFDISDQESFESIPDHEWDRHVASSSEFEDWETMLSAGVEQYVLENLGSPSQPESTNAEPDADTDADDRLEDSAELRA